VFYSRGRVRDIGSRKAEGRAGRYVKFAKRKPIEAISGGKIFDPRSLVLLSKGKVTSKRGHCRELKNIAISRLVMEAFGSRRGGRHDQLGEPCQDRSAKDICAYNESFYATQKEF